MIFPKISMSSPVLLIRNEEVLKALDPRAVLEGLLGDQGSGTPEYSFYEGGGNLFTMQIIYAPYQLVITFVFRTEENNINIYELHSTVIQKKESVLLAFWNNFEIELKQVLKLHGDIG